MEVFQCICADRVRTTTRREGHCIHATRSGWSQVEERSPREQASLLGQLGRLHADDSATALQVGRDVGCRAQRRTSDLFLERCIAVQSPVDWQNRGSIRRRGTLWHEAPVHRPGSLKTANQEQLDEVGSRKQVREWKANFATTCSPAFQIKRRR